MALGGDAVDKADGDNLLDFNQEKKIDGFCRYPTDRIFQCFRFLLFSVFLLPLSVVLDLRRNLTEDEKTFCSYVAAIVFLVLSKMMVNQTIVDFMILPTLS